MYTQHAPRKLSQGRIILGTRMRPRTYQSFPNVASFRVQRHFRDHEKRPFGCSKLQWQRVEFLMVPAEMYSKENHVGMGQNPGT